jgi:gentisate 1,2-dioxygenase
LVEMCIRGSGEIAVGETRTFSVAQFDVWNIPSMDVHHYKNTGKDLMVRLTFSNAPLLEALEVHYVEQDPPRRSTGTIIPNAPRTRSRDLAQNFEITKAGARLASYEFLVDIDVRESKALHWPWSVVSKHLPSVRDLPKGYSGRRLFALYNPATGRRFGATHSFFATIASYPPDQVDKPHRHSSAAINYYFAGSGRSVVEGRKLDWSAGDLMLSAPGWAVHNHSAKSEGAYILTIQDHPLHIAMESLIWQEDLSGEIHNLGATGGIETNLREIASR